MRLALLAAIALVLGPAFAQAPNGRPAANPTAAPRADSGGGEGSAPIPEPSTLLLVGTGLLGVALTARWRRRSR
ncbi:MAG: PEP-CTERM sorting domain-containing protein [Planctomycetota bacterium]